MSNNISYNYKALELLNDDILDLNKIVVAGYNINLIVYSINTNYKQPFLSFLTLKSDINEILNIPIINNNKILNTFNNDYFQLLNYSKLYLLTLLKLDFVIYQNNINYNGYYYCNNNYYLFFELKELIFDVFKLKSNNLTNNNINLNNLVIQKETFEENNIYFITSYEIINTQTVFSFLIDPYLLKFFYNTSDFLILYKNNVPIEYPFVSYREKKSIHELKFSLCNCEPISNHSIIKPYFFTSYNNCCILLNHYHNNNQNHNQNNNQIKTVIRYILFFDNLQIIDNYKNLNIIHNSLANNFYYNDSIIFNSCNLDDCNYYITKEYNNFRVLDYLHT